MKNRIRISLVAGTALLAAGLSGCSFGDPKVEEQVVVTVTPTPQVAATATPTPTVEATPTTAATQTPAASDAKYTSADGSISIELPDSTWSVKTDETDLLSAESATQGKILITHGAGETAMATKVLPDTLDTATALEQGAGLTEGTDFEIQDYTSSTDENGVGEYSYTVKMANPQTAGYAYIVRKVYANADSYYSLDGTVLNDSAVDLAAVTKAINSFAINGESTLKTATNTPTTTSATTVTSTTGVVGATGGTTTDGTSTDTSSASGASTASQAMSNANLDDTSQARTIYNGNTGGAFAIYSDGNGGWVDSDGISYTFDTDEDVYDSEGGQYWYGGEPASLVTGSSTSDSSASSSTDSSTGTADSASASEAMNNANLDDTSQARTIYNSNTGGAFAIYSDGNGGWVDSSGTYYTFDTSEDVYDSSGNEYWYGGEAASLVAGSSSSGSSSSGSSSGSDDSSSSDSGYSDSGDGGYYGNGDSIRIYDAGGGSFTVYDGGDGNYYDRDGNSYSFYSDEDLSDAYGNSYWYEAY